MTILADVHDYWNRESCGAGVTAAPKHSREYFEEIEQYRYRVEPEIFAFAQFTRHAGEKMLEVGVGAGTDFLQWCRAGTQAYGIDLTEEAIANVRERLNIYGQRAAELKVANAETLPYPDDTFDLVYSWGVIHHSPDPEKAFSEIARVTRRGGTVKLMLYHRHSLVALYLWVRYALLRGRPWRSLSDVLYHHMESIGTRAYTRSEIRDMARRHGLSVRSVDVTASPTYDLLAQYPWPLRAIAYVLASLLGYSRCGWYMRVEMTNSATGDYSAPFQQISSRAGSDFPDVTETLYGVNKRARWVAEALSKFDNPDILDVGCGTGELLTIPIARRGYRITGTDLHLPSIEHARSVAGSAARFVHGTPHDAGGTYDVIILSEVLEHVHEPMEMLSDLRSRLKPGGSLLLTVPNGRGPFEIDQWFWKGNFLWIPRLYASYVAGREVSGESATLNDDNPHVQFFTKRALANVVHSAGFEIAQWAPRSFICGSFPAIAIGALRLTTEAIARFNASVADKLPLSMASGWMLELKAR